MVWVPLGFVAVCVAAALLIMVKRSAKDGGTRERDLGSVSASWLNDRRGHGDVDPNR